MDIKAGMIIEYSNMMNPRTRIGKVIEVLTIEDHLDYSLIGKKSYMVDELDSTIVNQRVEESEIESVYASVYEKIQPKCEE